MMFAVVVAWWLAKDGAPWWLYALAALGMAVDEYRDWRSRRKL